jgi:hypothetical protein
LIIVSNITILVMGQEMCPVKGKHGFWEFPVC